MSSILDNAILVGKETTYGTPATLTRAFEAQADTWKREQDALESVGFRAGQQTLRSDRRKQINMGAAGAIELDALTSGLGLLLDGVLWPDADRRYYSVHVYVHHYLGRFSGLVHDSEADLAQRWYAHTVHLSRRCCHRL